jgi:hypothetical protein
MNMMKRTLISALAVALAFIGAGCKSSSTTLEPPVVTTEVVNDGGTLRLNWQAVDGATSYEITAGDSVYTTTSTSFDVSVPAATIEVRSAKDSNKSDSAAKVSCKIVESTVELFGDLTPTHENGFGFNDNGAAVACTLSYPSNLNMDFYAEYVGGEMKLVPAKMSPSRVGDAIKAASGSYDDITIADPVGTYSGAKLTVMVDSACFLRMSADTSATWSAENRFAKAKVVSIDSLKVTLNLGYQKVAGLRWLVK